MNADVSDRQAEYDMLNAVDADVAFAQMKTRLRALLEDDLTKAIQATSEMQMGA